MQMMHLIKAIKPIVINAKKNARIPVKITTKINAGFRTIERATIAEIIVPITPVRRQRAFLHRHFLNAPDNVTAPRNTPRTSKSRIKTAKPNTIQTTVFISGIKFRANKTATSVPKIKLITTPRQLHAENPHFSLQDISSVTSFCLN